MIHSVQKTRLVLPILLMLVWSGLKAQDPASYVNPFIGTSNFGACYPGAVVPNGMVSVVPYNVTLDDLNPLNTDSRWLSNPFVSDNSFMTGFTHVNLSGVGCPDLGSIILMPTTGKLEVDKNKYGSTYSDQVAKPGYYSTTINKYNIKAEVSSTQRVGISRYTFPKGQSNILLNLGLGLTNESGAYTKIVSPTEIEGSKLLGTFCYNKDAVFPIYFVVKFSKPAKDRGYFKFQQPLAGPRAQWSSTSGKYKIYKKYYKEMAGDNIGTFFTFDTKDGEQIEVKVGVSYVSIDNARQNMEVEQPSFNFNKVADSAYKSWNSELSRIKVEGGTEDNKTVFYSALYHILLHPNILQDVNGQYPAMESDQILTAQDRNRYTVFSLWDTYRNVHPFLSLAYPEKQREMVQTMIDMYDESGWLPKWELYGRETYVMEGDPSLPVITDTYLRGIRGFDINKAYKAMLKSATTKQKLNPLRPDNDFYLKHGYVPFTHNFDNSVSHALEYYIADWNLSRLAFALGDKENGKHFEKQSKGYRNYFNKEYQLFVPKKEDGHFIENFDPTMGENFEPAHGFHEGTSWNYSFYVPHDIKGLIKLYGGNKRFVERLETSFVKQHYDPANEPDIAYPYLFNYIKGQEWQTQKWIDTLRHDYTNKPDGIPGNDDTGTLSAWIVYSMMGIYPVCPGDMNYAITTPLFDKVTIELDPTVYPGQSFTIEKKGDKGDIYIDSMKWNAKKWNKFFISHQEITKGGTLFINTTNKN
ncbi:GH92 family glycosyl hydrolase [Halosquirtibacter xylanolyticus]|uniref:GH92 family glycosyl hydrolase n=1 Tax=Halosquirtibacter xylanolyticus TaxID=3374599 RepID=UPI003748C2EF|nr:GH92 family glycosyl hydrolase [Prolixibacteraceae bacterium]